MSSTDAAKLYQDESIDFVFIDAEHDERSVYTDISAWWPKIKKGGILGGDDYSYLWPGVEVAVNRFFGPQEMTIHIDWPPMWHVCKS